MNDGDVKKCKRNGCCWSSWRGVVERRRVGAGVCDGWMQSEFYHATKAEAEAAVAARVVIILRGLPGSGKDALAGVLGGVVVSEDDYHANAGGTGVYRFRERERYQAIGFMVDAAICQMMRATPRIVVATCALTLGELAGIRRAADKIGYRVFTVVVQNSHGNKSVHGVSDEDYEWMRANMDTSLDLRAQPERVGAARQA